MYDSTMASISYHIIDTLPGPTQYSIANRIDDHPSECSVPFAFSSVRSSHRCGLAWLGEGEDYPVMNG